VKLIFLGTPDFAVPSFQRLAAEPYPVITAISQPDRPQGRNRQTLPTPVKQAALAAGVPLLQPENPNDPAMLEKIRALKPDCAIVVAYGRLLSRSFLDLFPKGVYNLHASLLPKYRGAAPIQWALINGEPETGVTVFRLDEQLDHGPVLLQKKTLITPEEDGHSLFKRLAELGAEAAAEAADLIASGTAALKPQDESKVILAPRLSKETGRIDWNLDCRQIHHLIRGVQPWPGAFTTWEGKELKIHASSFDAGKNDSSAEPGTIVAADPLLGFWVQTSQGQLRIDRLQAAGGQVLPAADYLRGHPIRPGSRLTT